MHLHGDMLEFAVVLLIPVAALAFTLLSGRALWTWHLPWKWQETRFVSRSGDPRRYWIVVGFWTLLGVTLWATLGVAVIPDIVREISN
jgi:hypothetical protein